MRRSVLIVLVVMMPAWGQAQLDPRTDGIGIYFDEGGLTNCINTTVPYQPVVAYLAATRISAGSGISGWECAVTIAGDHVAQSWSVRWNGTNFLTPPLFAVGFGTGPMPAQPVCVLASCHGYMLSPSSEVLFWIDGLPTPSLPEFPHNPVYAAGTNSADLRPLWQSTGGYDVPVAAINGDCPVPERQSTWGGVKALYE
jgi:hypothetical protein